jgi:hypothetical protein
MFIIQIIRRLIDIISKNGSKNGYTEDDIHSKKKKEAKYTKEHGKIKNTEALEIKNKETTLSHITT